MVLGNRFDDPHPQAAEVQLLITGILKETDHGSAANLVSLIPSTVGRRSEQFGIRVHS